MEPRLQARKASLQFPEMRRKFFAAAGAGVGPHAPKGFRAGVLTAGGATSACAQRESGIVLVIGI